MFSILGVLGYTGSVDDTQEVDILTFLENVLLGSTVGRIFWFQNIITVFLAFPFKFYIGKEFIFLLIDEITKRSLSSKIDQLKTCTSTRGVFTEQMVKEVRKDIFQIVRQPFLKYSRLKYNLIVSIVLLPNFILAGLFYSTAHSNQFFEIFLRSEMVKIYKGGVVPFVMFFLPGLLYYRACIYYQDE